MRTLFDALREIQVISNRNGLFGIALLAAVTLVAPAQTPAPQPPAQPAERPSPQAPAATAPNPDGQAPSLNPAAATPQSGAADPADQKEASAATVKDPTLTRGAFSVQTVGGEIKEDQLKQILVGKILYLRAGYQDNNLEFDERGRLMGHSAQGSYTLSQVQINKLKLSKHKLELEGDRYGLHFLGAAPYEDPAAATDRVKITPKKKMVRICFIREQVETPKKKKEKNKDKHNQHDRDQAKAEAAARKAPNDSPAAQQSASPSVPDGAPEPNVADDRRSNDKRVTTTTSAAHASQLLLTALDSVFSPGIDQRMIAAMPDFWRLYYHAAADKAGYQPTEPGVFHQSAVDRKAKLITALDPPSNEFAQANGVAGMALYHVVIGSDGKVEEVVAGRPIGFGLDESAEQTIRTAAFQPAVKDGKPVPVALDLVVSFRIYSNRTSPSGAPQTSEKTDAAGRPGPYTVQTQTTHQSQPAQ